MAAALTGEALATQVGACVFLGLVRGLGGYLQHAFLQLGSDVFLVEARQVDDDIVALLVFLDVGAHQVGRCLRCGHVTEECIERIAHEVVEHAATSAGY